MSLPTVAAARVYKNQQKALHAEHDGETTNILADYDGNNDKLVWEKFPHTGLSMVRFIINDDISY